MEQKPVDAGQFKIGMRTLAGAVNIITSFHSGHRYGMTATAVCSATADPPTVLACINKLATTHGAVAKSKVFCVNVLRKRHLVSVKLRRTWKISRAVAVKTRRTRTRRKRASSWPKGKIASLTV